MNSNRSLLMVAPLFLVLFIDGMGLGLLFPILNGIIIDPTSGFLPTNLSLSEREFLYGFIVGIFMVCWFFGAAILGDLSDVIGRKRSLLICLIGAFIGYLLSAIAIVVHSTVLLVVGRMVAGFTAGSQPIAQAAIVDVSPPEHKTRNIGLILLAVSLGFIFGPMLGGLLSSPKVVSWFSYSTPMVFAFVISLLNAFLLWWMFSETFTVSGKISIKYHHAIHVFISAFKHPSIRWLSLAMLIMIFGWSNYFTFISLFLLKMYHYSTLEVSLFLATMGIGFSLGCGYFVEFCSKRFQPKNIVIVTLFITAGCVLITVLGPSVYYAWLCVIPIGLFLAVAYSTLLAIFSNQVSDKEQGWVMGVTGSIMALCFGLTSFLTGWVASFSVGLPLYLSVLGLGGSAFLLVFIRSSKNL